MGLISVFLADGLRAFLDPQSFIDLLNTSFVTQILPISTSVFLLLIGVNNLVMAVLMALNRYPKYVFGWATVWMVLVLIVIAEPLSVLERLGFFAMSLTLLLEAVSHDKTPNKI